MAPKNKKNLTSAPIVPVLSSSTQMWGWAALGWAVFTLVYYWNRFSFIADMPQIPPLSSNPVDGMVFVQDAKALFLLITTLPTCAALGSYLLRSFRVTWHSRLEHAVFSLGMGLAALGYLIFALGLLQLYTPLMFWGLWALGLGLTWHRWVRGRSGSLFNDVAHTLNQWHTEHRRWRFQIAMLWAVVVVAGLMAFVPEIFYDSMVYHLGVPNWYLHEGGIKYYPAIHAQFPFLRQMLNVWGLALGGERLAKLIHASSTPLMIATYLALARRYSYPKTTVIAALALFTMPMVNMNLWTAGIDVGMAAFALLAFLAWMNGLTDTALRTRWFVLAGIFGGFCFSSKYPGLIFVFCMSLTTLIWLGIAEKNWMGGLREGFRIGIIACLVTLPWLIKSWVFTGNPVYPYLFHIFKSRDLFPDRAFDFMSDTQTGAKHNILDLLATPWTQTFTEISSFSSPGIFLFGFLGFLTVGLFRKEMRSRAYVAGVLFFGFYWFITNAMTDRIRLGISGIAVGCFLLAHPAGFLYHQGGKTFKTLLALFVGIAGFTGLLSTFPTICNAYVPWDVLTGRESAAHYLSYTHSGMDPYPAMNGFVDAQQFVPPGHRLLIVGDEKTSPCPIPYLASGVHNNSLIVQWSLDAQTVDDLVKRFEENHVSHMMVNVAETQRLINYKILNWDDRSLALYCAFFEQHMRLMHQSAIVERFFKQSTPLLFYEFSAQPLTTHPSENILLELYENFRVSPNDPLAIKKRIDILQAVDAAYPGLENTRVGIAYWRAQENRAH